MKLSKLFPMLTVCCLLSGFLIGCAERESEDIHREETPAVSATKVKQQDLEEYLYYSGDIEAEDEALVYSKVSGKLLKNEVQEGDLVEKDQTLALVDRDEIGYEFEFAPVASPIEGTVGRAYLDKGAQVNLNTPIALIVNIDEVSVKIDVTEKDLPKVVKGQMGQVKVDAYPAETFQGRVSKVSPVIDLDTRTAPVWISIDNSGHKLKPGMFARIKLAVGKHRGVLVILRDAIIGEDSQRYVFIVKENQAYKRKITLGLQSEDKFQVLNGLSLGETVIIMAPSDLKDGHKVRVVEEVQQ